MNVNGAIFLMLTNQTFSNMFPAVNVRFIYLNITNKVNSSDSDCTILVNTIYIFRYFVWNLEYSCVSISMECIEQIHII